MVVTRPARASRTSPSRQAATPARSVPGLAARQTATRLLAAVVEAKTPLDGMTDAQHGHPQYRALDERDRGLVRAILVSALRHRNTIAALISERLDRPLPGNAHMLSHILHVALAQMLFLDVPDSAAVDLAVEQAKADPRTQRFASLVNAVLRGAGRAKEEALPRLLAATRDAPDWFVRRMEKAYGAEATAAILAAHRLEPPVDFTVKADAAGLAERLGGIVLPTGSVRIEKLDRSVTELPGYAEGEWWVQDAAAALPARIMGEVAGKRVADLCAAPGGKTAQLVLAGAKVTAVEISANRLKRLAANLARLNLDAELVTADLAAYQPVELFDAILLDAPCSSTGTVRRHPDVLWTKSEADIAKLAEVQRTLLGHAARMLKPGGTLVFSNCSLDPQEGEDLIRAFLSETPGFSLDPIRADEISGIAEFVTPEGFLRTTPAGLRMETPQLSGLDGFFAARFGKSS
ncbi:MAG: RsmB/NOP family class I SAM-dependent RNA methyltransferase [Mesorhizobium sp.]|nr:RsmB/NOP family class I SAM-dependent RNA methyltransferase [Mesorhizobium sp.]MCO5162140.1 RsmB/NOP family class I SAM-dependent RNA methyltransferase [Mesorhizobium sp.]